MKNQKFRDDFWQIAALIAMFLLPVIAALLAGMGEG